MLAQFDSLILTSSTKYNIPVSWIKAVIQTESSGNPNSSNPADPSYGLGGFKLATAKSLGYKGDAKGLYDPATSIDLVAHYLNDLRLKFGDDIRRVYSAYNSGKPDLYKTSAEVAKNVDRLLGNLQLVVQNEPFILSMGAIAVLISLMVVWYYTRSLK